jgi:hypothetical protein
MKISDILLQSKVNDSKMLEVVRCHPRQIASETIDIPCWKVVYSYKTNRGNDKQATKYFFLPESSWDVIDMEFKEHIEKLNKNHPERKISNVEILDCSYLGELVLGLD